MVRCGQNAQVGAPRVDLRLLFFFFLRFHFKFIGRAVIIPAWKNPKRGSKPACARKYQTNVAQMRHNELRQKFCYPGGVVKEG